MPSLAWLQPPPDHATDTLGALRRRGVQVWAAIGWAALVPLLISNAVLGTGIGVPLLLIGAATNIGPTMMALRGRHDAEARMLVGALAAVIPAMLVAVLRGHPWQMDAHMYFFVGMAGLVVLADWRPLAIATALTAIHHTMLEWLAPHLVFTGTGNSGRVVFHVIAVALQFVALSVLTRRLERLVDAQDAALATSHAHAAAAEAERSRALAAMGQARDAEAQAGRERRARDEAMKRAAAARRDELLALADRFERSVTGVAKSIGDATGRLERSALHLDETIAGADDAAGEVATGASLASAEMAEVALSIHDLSHSVHAIATTAGRQTALTGQASDEAQRSVRTFALLEERTTMIEGLVGDIRKIAHQTNLLALNATIEAARAGEAGRGFTIVANEVKALAANSRVATDRIGELLVGIRDGVVEASAKLRTVNSVIGEVAVAADGIAQAVERQQETARDVGAGTDRAVESSASIERRIAQVATASGVVAGLSTQVKSSASELSRGARELLTSTDQFVSYLQREEQSAA